MNRIVVIVLLALVAVLVGVSYADGPYHGRVIDAETKQPIDGAAVVAVWFEAVPYSSGFYSRVYEVYEAITDRQGVFTIPGIPLGSDIKDPALNIYKPGYAAYILGPVFIPTGVTVEEGVYMKDGYLVVELPPAKTDVERKRHLQKAVSLPNCPKMPSGQVNPECIPLEKVPYWAGLVNTEQQTLGIKHEPAQPKRPSDPTNKVIK